MIRHPLVILESNTGSLRRTKITMEGKKEEYHCKIGKERLEKHLEKRDQEEWRFKILGNIYRILLMRFIRQVERLRYEIGFNSLKRSRS